MTNFRVTVLVAVLSCVTHLLLAAELPTKLRCEWRTDPTDISDPCPEFYWETASQSACRVRVAKSEVDLKEAKDLLWDSGKVETGLPIVEYAGPELANGVPYFWTVDVWDAAGTPMPPSGVQRFTLNVQPMPHHLPSIRTFINFAGTPEFARDWLDLSFRKEAKQGRSDVLVVRYGLVCTLVLPHPSTGKPLEGKAAQLADFCVAKGLTDEGILEDMFCHFAVDTKVNLHVGAERAAAPRETRVVPGWDPRNDRNGDGRVDDAEFTELVNPNAMAREAREARVPIYFWGPPRDDFVMNVGHPAYQEFMATVHAPAICEEYDGIYFDTVPTDVAGSGRNAKIVEYPREGKDHDRWLRDLQVLFARIKIQLPDKLITGNGWNANPMVLEGRQSEGWQCLNRQASSWQRALDQAVELDRRGKIQLIQYNPVFDPELAEFGPKLPVSQDRDKIFGLATYLLAHGRFTYFGFGRHPYAKVQQTWFDAMRADLGEPTGPYRLWAEVDAMAGGDKENLLTNGGFETAAPNGKPARWTAAEPVVLDDTVQHGGKCSVKITSSNRLINNINRIGVELKPHTDYTLIAWAKTEGVEGAPGAQVYPYEFEDAAGKGMMTWNGTHDWSEQRMVIRTSDDGEGRINFRMYGATGTVWFDNLQLVEGIAVKQPLFAREYTKALVLVKPYTGGSFGDETASAHNLPGEFRPLKVDGVLGEPVRQVTLRNGEAAILVK